VLDEQQLPGGQIYRSLEKARAENAPVLGKDYFHGQSLIEQFRQSDAEYLPGANIWDLGRDLIIGYLAAGKARQVRARKILISAGAMERPVPIPGWTLPGVMGAAAADILFKSCDMVPAGPVVLAGSGPLQLLVACHLIDNGVKVAALVETCGFLDNLKALPYLPQALRVWPYLVKGLSMRWKVRRAGVPIFQNATKLRIAGEESAEELCFEVRGREHRIPAKTILLHENVVPNLQLTRLLGCEHQWYARQRYWKPVLDRWGQTSVHGIFVAGDAGGIFGAKTAEAAGHLAAINIAFRLQVITAQEQAAVATPFFKTQAKERSIRPFLDCLFPPGTQALAPPSNETLVCRCEELTAGQIRDAVRLGAISPGQVKAQTRAGMGPCQGRMCGLTIAEIIAESRQVPLSEVGQLRVRPPLKPLTLGQLADLELVE
jgi:NADPH-dependent 2,4-dienoyl-CoA reductase/sulfur reductase-like enzyme